MATIGTSAEIPRTVKATFVLTTSLCVVATRAARSARSLRYVSGSHDDSQTEVVKPQGRRDVWNRNDVGILVLRELLNQGGDDGVVIGQHHVARCLRG